MQDDSTPASEHGRRSECVQLLQVRKVLKNQPCLRSTPLTTLCTALACLWSSVAAALETYGPRAEIVWLIRRPRKRH